MRRLLLVAAFLAVISAVVVGGHLYLARRLVLQPEPAAWLRQFLLALVVAGGALLVAQPLCERLGPRALARWVAWPASLWMGFAFYLFAATAATDVPGALMGAAAESGSPASLAAARVQALSVFAVALLAGGAGLRGALAPPRLERIEIALPRLPAGLDGFRIVQLSDVHIGPLLDRRFAAHLVERCRALAPDLIAVTGDLVDGSVRHLAAEVAPLAELRAPHGVYFVTGNHDYYSGADSWVACVERLGWRALRNRRVVIGAGEASFDLAGVEDHHAHLVSRTHREDLEAALSGRDVARPCVLLAHDPGTFAKASRLGVDLQLSGHTHGGQIWPFRYLVRLSTRWVAGHYRAGASQLYVSRGTGFWGPAMRLFAPAEITEIVLRRAPLPTTPSPSAPSARPPALPPPEPPGRRRPPCAAPPHSVSRTLPPRGGVAQLARARVS